MKPATGYALGALGLGLLALGAVASQGERVAGALIPLSEWIAVALKKAAAHESGKAAFSAVQRNQDGQGLSYGLIQWTQAGGGLGVLLGKMQAADPTMFARAFGPSWGILLAQTRIASMAPIDGANLWEEPWVSRFEDAGEIPVFQHVQIEEAANGPYGRAAIEAAHLLGVRSERAMVMLYDRAIQQGAGGLLADARALVQQWKQFPRPPTERGILLQLGWLAASHYRRIGAPAQTAYGTRGSVWRPVPAEYPELGPGDSWSTTARVQAPPDTWHVFPANFNVSLYDIITHRVRDILNDIGLRDGPVELS